MKEMERRVLKKDNKECSNGKNLKKKERGIGRRKGTMKERVKKERKKKREKERG